MFIYLISIWFLQIIIYYLITFKKIGWRVKKRDAFFVAVLLFFTAPWLFSIGREINPETGEREYVCGLAGLIPLFFFWVVGNVGNVVILLVFKGIKPNLKKEP